MHLYIFVMGSLLDKLPQGNDYKVMILFRGEKIE